MKPRFLITWTVLNSTKFYLRALNIEALNLICSDSKYIEFLNDNGGYLLPYSYRG